MMCIVTLFDLSSKKTLKATQIRLNILGGMTKLLEEYKELIPYGKGYLVSSNIEIAYQGSLKNIPAGSLVHSDPDLKISTTLKPAQLRKTLSYAYAAKTLADRHSKDSNIFLYTNRRSGYLVNEGNRILLRAVKSPQNLHGLKEEFLSTISQCFNKGFTAEIDANAKQHDNFFKAQAPKVPIISQHFINSHEPDTMTESKNKVFAYVVNNPQLLRLLTDINMYYQKYHPDLSKALKGEVVTQTHSLLEDNNDFFPSNSALSAIATYMQSTARQSEKTLFSEFVDNISMLLCNTYIFLEIFDAISIKLHDPSALLVTKYTAAETYTKSIISCITLVCAAITDKLDTLLESITGKNGNYDLSMISTEAPPSKEYAKKLSLSTTAPVYKALLSEIGIDSLYSHKLEASKFNARTNHPSNIKILPDPFHSKKQKLQKAEVKKNIILMVCWNEIFAGETVATEQIKYQPPGGASLYNRLAYCAMNTFSWSAPTKKQPCSPTGSPSSYGHGSSTTDDTRDPRMAFTTITQVH